MRATTLAPAFVFENGSFNDSRRTHRPRGPEADPAMEGGSWPICRDPDHTGVGIVLWWPATRGLNGAELVAARLDAIKVALGIAVEAAACSGSTWPGGVSGRLRRTWATVSARSRTSSK